MLILPIRYVWVWGAMADSFSCCFVSGVVFLAISFFKVREAIVNAIPMSLKFAIGGGIGLLWRLLR